MLRTYLSVLSCLIAKGMPIYGFYLRRPRPYIADRSIHNKAPPPQGGRSSYPSNLPDGLKFPNSFLELVEFIRSVEKARKMAVNKDELNPESSKRKKRKNKKESQAKEDQSEKQKSINEPKLKEGNEHIVAALVEAINNDYWPDIIYYSTLHPRHLQGWHPEESECLAGHRMSVALKKLARIWAKKRLDQVDYIPGVDYDEDLLAMDIPWPAWPNKPKEPWTFEMNGFTLRRELNKKESTGSDGSVQSGVSDKPGSAST